MTFKKANKAAALALVAAFGAACSEDANALICNSSNTADFTALNLDIENIPTSSFPGRMYVSIKNLGPGVNMDFIYYDIFELDAARNRVAHIKMVNTSTTVPVNGQVLRTITFAPGLLTQGVEYEASLRYACDPNLTNNSAFQRAYNIGGLPDSIFKDGMETPPAAVAPTAQSLNKSLQDLANDNEVVITDKKFENGEFEILGFIRPKTPKP